MAIRLECSVMHGSRDWMGGRISSRIATSSSVARFITLMVSGMMS